jgi:hypothetical protein
MRDRKVKSNPGPHREILRRPGLPGLVGRVRFVSGEGGLRDAALTDVREECQGPGTVAPLRH